MAARPVIDVEPLVRGEGDVLAVARQIDTACREMGFFYISGHGVDEHLQARLEALARAAFALPVDQKAEIAMTRGGLAWRGCSPLDQTEGAARRWQ